MFASLPLQLFIIAQILFPSITELNLESEKGQTVLTSPFFTITLSLLSLNTDHLTPLLSLDHTQIHTGEKECWNSLKKILSVARLVILLLLFRATPSAYRSSQARGQIGPTAASLHHSHSNGGSEPRLQSTPQIMAMLDP